MRCRFRGVVAFVVAVIASAAPLWAAGADSRLAEAVKHRDREAVRALLARHADVNGALADGTTALHWAAHWDDVDTVNALIRAGARADAKDDYGVTPLWLACTNGNVAVADKLLEAGADPNGALPSGETALMTAAHTGEAGIVSRLLTRGAKVNVQEPSLGQTPLMWAAAEGHAAAVDLLVQHSADIRSRSKAGYTPLLLAARSGVVQAAGILLKAGADVNEAAPDGTTPLTVATIRGHVELVKFLLDRGANPNLGPGFTPLHWVSGFWSNELTGRNALKDEGSEWGTLEGYQGQAKLDLIKLLLAHGAEVNARAKSNPRYESGMRMQENSGSNRNRVLPSMAGATPFWMAAKAGEIEVMRLLLANGADPLLTTTAKTTALMTAAGVGSGTGSTAVPEERALLAVKLCVELGNDVNAVNADGVTALHGAAFRGPQGEDTIIQFLVDKGAKVNVKDKRGWTPLIIVEGLYFAATNTYSPSAAELLRKLGAEPTPPGIDRNVGTTVGSLSINN